MGGARGALPPPPPLRPPHPPPPIFLQSLNFFCNHFEELQTELLEVELIVNNAPLTYVCPNTIETCV